MIIVKKYYKLSNIQKIDIFFTPNVYYEIADDGGYKNK